MTSLFLSRASTADHGLRRLAQTLYRLGSPLKRRAGGNPTLSPETPERLARARRRVVIGIRLLLVAVMLVAAACTVAMVLIQFGPLEDGLKLGAQGLLGVLAFATCTYLLYERIELRLDLYDFEPVDQTALGELRALLNRLPEGAAYQVALGAQQRPLTMGEAKRIQGRVYAEMPADPY